MLIFVMKHFVLTLLGLLSFCLAIRAEVYSGECGDNGNNLTWTLDTETGKLVTTARGLSLVMKNGALQFSGNQTVTGTFDTFDMDLNVVDKEGNTSFRVRRIPTMELMRIVFDAETKKQRNTQARGGTVKAPCADLFPATSKQPGMTGTGAPVTEQLRCRLCGELGWYRDLFAPTICRGGF